MDHRGNDRTPFWTEGGRGFHEAHDAWWETALHAVLLLAVVALIIVGIVWLVRRLSTPGGPLAASGAAAPVVPAAPSTPVVDDGALAALRLRYARGEVDRQTYLTTFADLTGRTEPWPGPAPTSEAPTAVDVATETEPPVSDVPAEPEGERPSA